MTRRTIFAALAIVAAVGCGKSDEQKAAEQAAQQAQQAAQSAQQGAQSAQQGAQQVAQGLQQMAQGLQAGQAGNVKLVDSDELKALLPDVSGWEKKNSKSEQMSLGVASFSHAETHYENGDAEIKLDITDSAMSQLVLAPFVMFITSGYSEKTDDGYKKSTVISGTPGFESWDKTNKRAEVVAIVGNRFIVQGTGQSVDGVEIVRKVVESVNLSKLAGLK
jgi:uncharacterized phage infection (PIP) family protein YhgE